MAANDETIRIDVRQALADIAQLKGGLADLRTQVVKTGDAGRAAFSGIGPDALKEARDIDALKRKYLEVKEAAATLRKALDNAYDPRAIKTYSQALGQAQAGLKKLEDGAEAAGISLKDVSKEASVGKQVVGELFSAFSIAGLVAGVAGLVKHAVDLAKNYEVARASFAAFLGDAEKADKVLAELTDFAARTPLSGEEVNAAGKALLAFGESADSLVPTLSRIGDIAKGTGKDFGELTTIYGKARTAGVLYAEDINQLVEAGVPIIQEFAKQIGVTNEQVKKLASEGKIGFSQLELAFFNLTSEGGKFYGQLNAFSDTLQGKTDNLSASFDRLLLKLSSLFGPVLKKIVDSLSSGLDRIDDAFSNFGEGGIIESSLKGASNAAYFLSGGLIDIKTKSKEASKELSNIGKEFLTGQKQAPDFGPLQTADQRQRAALQKAANDERQRLDSAANAKLAEGRAKAAAAEAKRRQQEHEAQLREQAQFNREANDLRLQQLDPESEQFAIVKELQRFDDQRAAFLKHKLDTEEIEKQHTKNLLRIQIEFYLERQAKIDKSIQDEKDSIQRGFDELASLAKDDAERKTKNNENVLRVRTQAEELRAAIFEEQELSNKALFFSKERSDAEIEEYDKRVAKAREIFQLEQQAIALQNLIEFDKTLSSAEVATLETRVKNIQTKIGQLAAGVGEGKEKGKGFLQSLFPDFSGDELDQLKASLNQAKDEIFGFLQEVSDARLEAADRRLEAAEKEVEAAQLAYDKEKEIDDLGFANSLETAEKNLATAKANEEKALQLKREAQKKQLNLDAAMQASSLITAAANTFKGFSSIPLVGQILAVVSIAAMFAAFASAQAKARAAIKFREGGPVKGPTHERGGVPIEAEGGEFVTSRRATAQHFNLLEAVNKRDDPALDRWALGRVAKLDRVAVGQAIGEGKGTTTVIVQAKEDRKAHDLLRAIRDKRQAPVTTVEGKYSVTRHNGRTVRKRI